MSHDEMAATMAEWNKGELDSFLIEISANILKYKDTDGEPLVEKIRDAAGQKGTGKWTAISALEYGMPVTLIGEAVFARCLSSIKVCVHIYCRKIIFTKKETLIRFLTHELLILFFWLLQWRNEVMKCVGSI